MRNLELWAAGPSTARTRYVHDQAMIARAALGPGTACLRVHSAAESGAALGRFHRRDASAGAGLERRLTGGRTTPTGPGLIELSLVVPSAGWLDTAVTSLRPEQILNRALRPFLSVLREAGIDAFYPGRDLITVEKAPLAACSFNVLPDGMVFVTTSIGVTDSLAALPERIVDLDPQGTAAVDAHCFDSARPLGVNTGPGLDQAAWVQAYAEAAQACWRCTANIASAEPAWLDSFTPPADEAYAAFLGERLAQNSDERTSTAASMTMLGVVEASAAIVDERMQGLEICGDVIAPAMTLSALSAACEGAVAAPPALRRATTQVLSEQRHFLLGFDGLDDLLCRLL